MITTESLFERYFLPLYPEDVRADLARVRDLAGVSNEDRQRAAAIEARIPPK